MPIRVFLMDHFALQHDLELDTVGQHRYMIARLEEFLGRVALIDDLRKNTVNRWLLSMQGSTLSPQSIRSRRRALLALWRAAFEQSLTNEFPRGYARSKLPLRFPKCWSIEQIGTLLETAKALPGAGANGPAPVESPGQTGGLPGYSPTTTLA